LITRRAPNRGEDAAPTVVFWPNGSIKGGIGLGQGGWLLGLGLALEAQGRLEEARSAYRNALDRGQFKPEVMQFLRERSGLSGP